MPMWVDDLPCSAYGEKPSMQASQDTIRPDGEHDGQRHLNVQLDVEPLGDRAAATLPCGP